MHDSFLKPENLKSATDFYENYEFKGDGMGGEPFIRFWSENTIQIDGDLTLEEMKELVKLMESFT